MALSLVLHKLRQPYVFNTSIQRRWLLCFSFGAFVFLFLYFFRPFDITHAPVGLFNACLGYGLTTFIIMALLNIALLPVFPKLLNEETWTVGKEIAWSLLNFLLIGLGNALFGAFVGNLKISAANIAVIEAYTLAVGIFPVTVSVLIKEARLKKQYERRSEEINADLKKTATVVVEENKPANEKQEKVIQVSPTIRIGSENAAEFLELSPDDLLYIQSSDNYIEVYYLDRNAVSKKLLRNSLKAVTESLEARAHLFRCHKSYLVNLRKVSHVSGNAQGYKLHIPGVEILVPVSRQYNAEIKDRLAGTP